MQSTQEIYRQTILPLPNAEKLKIASLILQNLTDENTLDKLSATGLLKKLPAGKIFENAVDADEFLRGERDSWER